VFAIHITYDEKKTSMTGCDEFSTLRKKSKEGKRCQSGLSLAGPEAAKPRFASRQSAKN
jgi:hypothetical protein